MTIKRILIFNDCFYMGGTEVLLVNLLNHLVDKNCNVTLLLPYPSEKNVLLERVSSKVIVKYIFDIQPRGVKALIMKNISIFFPKLFAKLVHFKDSEYDEIVCFKDGFYSIMLSQSICPKYIWIQNQPFIRDYSSNSFNERLAFMLNKKQIERMNDSFDKFDRIICVSDSSKKKYIDIYNKGKQSKNIEVVYNALNLSEIAKKAIFPIDLEKPKNTSFITVIRLSHEKTVERIMYASDRLRSEGYMFEVIILGDGDEYEKLQKLILELQLESYIKMYGRVDNPFPYMKRADWFLCPSSRESFALTLLESTSLGTPVITTDCGGPEDVVARGKYGVFVENSLEGVYNGMKKVMDDKSLLPYYVSKCDENMQRFNYIKWLSFVDELLGV